jgi:hypothetical protein
MRFSILSVGFGSKAHDNGKYRAVAGGTSHMVLSFFHTKRRDDRRDFALMGPLAAHAVRQQPRLMFASAYFFLRAGFLAFFAAFLAFFFATEISPFWQQA